MFFLKVPGNECHKPKRLVMTSVKEIGNQWVCDSCGEIKEDHCTLAHTLAKFIQQLDRSAQWSIKNYHTTDNGGNTITQAIRNNLTIAICGGSLKPGKGAIAWVIDRESTVNRIKEWNITPGKYEVHSTYRSELAGLFATVTMVNAICQVHPINSGSVVLLLH